MYYERGASDKKAQTSGIDEETSLILKEVCNIIISHCCSWFEFTGHLVAATLFDSGSFSSFEQCFPTKVVEVAAKSFPFLDKSRFCSELSVIYSRPEFRQCCGAVPLFQLLIESNLAGTFSETFSETVLLSESHYHNSNDFL